MPLVILIFLLLDLLSIVFIGLDVYFFREWYLHRKSDNLDYAHACMYTAAALLAFNLVGKYPISLLFSKWRRTENKPNRKRSESREFLKRPDGTRICIEQYGPEDGPPIIFVHGWNGNRLQWFYQRIFFSGKYRCILIDLPGAGKSSRPRHKDYTLTRMANDLDAVIKYTRAEKPILWGHGMGGMVALTYCVRFLKALKLEIKGVVLQHTTYVNPTRTSSMGDFLTASRRPVLAPLCFMFIIFSPVFAFMRRLSYMNGTHHLATRFLMFTGTQNWRQLDFAASLSARFQPSAFGRGMLAMFGWGVADQIDQINIPVLIIAGNKDRLTKPEASNFIHEKISGSVLYTASPAGHMGLMERHKEVNDAVLGFMEQLDMIQSSGI